MNTGHGARVWAGAGLAALGITRIGPNGSGTGLQAGQCINNSRAVISSSIK